MFKYFLIAFFALTSTAWSYATKYTRTIQDAQGNTYKMVPVEKSELALQGYISIVTDPDTASTMRDLKPWPVDMAKNTFQYYIASWTTFDDLKVAGVNPLPVMGVCFLLHTEDNKIAGSGGIQSSTRPQDASAPEIYFALLPPYRSKGLGTAFGKEIMHFFKENYGDRSLEAIVRPNNIPSKKLLAKLGFSPVLDPKQKPVIKNFPKWNNTEYAVYRYEPKE